VRKKTCKVCKKKFGPDRLMQTTCSFECAVEYARMQEQKRKKKATVERKREHRQNDRVWLRAEAQRLANKWGRLADELKHGRRCITCGSTTGKMDGGHAFPTSSYGSIRYYTTQINQQCYQCNRIHSGRYGEYRLILREIYGDEFVDYLEANRGVIRKYSTEWYQRFIVIARKRIRQLEKRISDGIF
jgi:hypothetical protein